MKVTKSFEPGLANIKLILAKTNQIRETPNHIELQNQTPPNSIQLYASEMDSTWSENYVMHKEKEICFYHGGCW